MSRAARGAAWLSIALLAAGAAGIASAAPGAPRDCFAIPDYGDASIVVEWDAVAGATGYRVYRATLAGGPFAQVGGDLAAGVTQLVDPGLDDSLEYHYRVTAFDDTGESAPSSTFRQNVKVVWPNAGHYALLHTWNDTIGVAGQNGLGYHRGCDFQQTGPVQNSVLVPRGGVVVRTGNNGNDNNLIAIEVRIGDDRRYDAFNHLDGSSVAALAVQLGDVVRAGQTIGKIGNSLFNSSQLDFVDHTHFDILLDPFVTAVDGEHPLKIFEEDEERDPGEVRPAIRDHASPSDGVVLFHRQGAPTGPPYLDLPLGDDPGTAEDEGDVDLHVEAADDMNGGAGTTQVPTSLAWWIEGRAIDGGAPVVRDASQPYRLFRWDHRFFLDEGVDWRLLVDEAQDLAPQIGHAGTAYPSTWNNYKHFIVTNTAGSDGEAVHVDGEQYWNTDAADDGSPATVAHANFAGLPDAARAQDARFPDGEYTLHVVSSDLLGSREESIPGIALENFPPAVREVCATDGAAGTEYAQVVFSEPMDTASVEAALTIVPLAGAPTVGFTPSWTADDSVLRLTPDSLPGPLDEYRILIDGGTARDLAAKLLDGAFARFSHNGISEGAPADTVVAKFAFAPLVEAQGLVLESTDPGTARLTWPVTAGAGSYAVTRGPLGGLGVGSYGSCLAPAVIAPSLTDADVPPQGEGFVYLVQADNACGAIGSLGEDSEGNLRTNGDPGACD